MPSVFVTAGLNVAYVYAIAFRHHDRAVLVFLFQEPDQTIAVLKWPVARRSMPSDWRRLWVEAEVDFHLPPR